jgi:hypothetical protein
MGPILRGLAMAGAFGLLTATAPSAGAADYRGSYWYDKYFDADDARPYRPREERDDLDRDEVQELAAEQGFFNAHHLHRAADRSEIYAMAREGEFNNEVAIVIDARSGDVTEVVVLPH